MKRNVMPILLVLIGGAIVNIAVAWGVRFVLNEDPVQLRDPAVFRTGGGGGTPPGQSRPTWAPAAARRQSGTLYSVVEQRDERTSRHVSTVHLVFSRADVYLRRESVYLNASAGPHSRTSEAFNALVGRTSGFRIAFNAEGKAMLANTTLCAEYSAGWPYRSLRWQGPFSEYADRSFGPCPPTSEGVRGAWSLPGSWGELRHDVPLPLLPLFPGFVINTVFYALLLWVIFYGPFAARRMLRRRRGVCAKCAYPIGTSPVCTECGAAVVREVQA